MTKIGLYIDDIRTPPPVFGDVNWKIARSSDAAISWITHNGIPQVISFDHDLGGEDTAMRVVHWIVEQTLDGKLTFPDGFVYHVHSANPVGADNIHGTMTNFLSHIAQ